MAIFTKEYPGISSQVSYHVLSIVEYLYFTWVFHCKIPQDISHSEATGMYMEVAVWAMECAWGISLKVVEVAAMTGMDENWSGTKWQHAM